MTSFFHFLSYSGRHQPHLSPKGGTTRPPQSQGPLLPGGGLRLTVTSSIAASSVFIFQIAMLTLLCVEQTDQVPTPNERPHQVLDVIADIARQGHAPWLRRLLLTVKEDPAEGTRPLPCLTPTLVLGHTLTWTSARNVGGPYVQTKTSPYARGISLTANPNPSQWDQGQCTPTSARISSSPS